MLQITSDDYKKSADSNAFLKKIEFPSRGIISDRNGQLMVYNQPSYDIMVVMNEARGHIDTLDFCNALNISRQEFDERMKAIMNTRGYSRFTEQLFMSQLSDKDFSIFQEKMYRFPGLLCAASQHPPVCLSLCSPRAGRRSRGVAGRHRGRRLLPARRLHRQAGRGALLREAAARREGRADTAARRPRPHQGQLSGTERSTRSPCRART